MKGIVGFELPIRRLEGKWKVSQNRTVEDRHGVIKGLSLLDGPESNVMAGLVADTLPQPGAPSSPGSLIAGQGGVSFAEANDRLPSKPASK